MNGKASWTVTVVLAVLTRLMTTEGGPLHYNKHRSYTTDELVQDPEREINSAYKELLSKRSHALDSKFTATADIGRGHEPKYHFEVHAVEHKMGHLIPADEKLKTVQRQASGLGVLHHADTTAAAANNDITNRNNNNAENHQQDLRLFDDTLRDIETFRQMETPNKKESTSEENLNPRHQDQNSYREDMQPDGTSQEMAPIALARQDPGRVDSPDAGVHSASSIADVYFLAVVAGCSVAGIAGLMLAAVCWYRLHKKIKAASEVDYPAYGVTGPSAATPSTCKDSRGPTGSGSGSPGDRKLAQSAQMYHYQHQKQQMIASERLASDSHPAAAAGSDVESDDENEEGDYTVFECPGLATNGEMEVRNPLFNDQTPAATPPVDSSSCQPASKQ